ncbi:amino acid adenylation protein [Streptomyces venezuelae]|uniref:Amino acid adenylation protein n=1 Tax=Streptomyces venezuelae TaxID=54571 RepID=A0A5P2BR46_STRVZ|nr:non-ribosomal peptide synthetase [Streptomyces venezuelae]QES32440.1 amino acid adenylation protein [Streptomyces venezuelae]
MTLSEQSFVSNAPHDELSPVHAEVARMAGSDPQRVAVRSGGTELSYGELDAWARRLAALVRAAGAGRGERIGVLVEPSHAMIAAVLGILYAGAAYVPADPAHPDQRIADVFADAGVSAVIVADGTSDRLTTLTYPVIRAEDAREGEGEEITAAAVAVTLDDAAYVIYTSGSTGEPKGVLVEHRQLSASTRARREVYPGAPVFLLVSPLAFDSSIAGVWGTLTAGGCLVVAASDEIRDPERLADLVERRQVTRLLCVPLLYNALLDAAARQGTRLDALDTVIVAGEALTEALMERHFALLGRTVALVNEYGPTEATVWASFRRYEAPGPVSIGGPVPGVRLYLLNEQLEPVPRGVSGELFIGGTGVARGYFGRPEATAQAFIGDPFTDVEGAKMYRTGDLARWNDDGEVEFLGRRDQQVKIRGHRIELGAVEAHLRTAPGVSDAVVVTNTERTQLVGFVLSPPDSSPELIREHVARRLPQAMVPNWIHVLDRFPVTANGKIDRKSLSALAETHPESRTEDGAAAPTDDTTGRVSAAWAEVLKRKDVPVEVNFFDLGGHSVKLFELQNALERHAGVRLSVVALFSHTTVAAQATLIRDGVPSDEGSAVVAQAASTRRSRALRARRQRLEGGERR